MANISETMKAAWNERAGRDAFFYVETANWDNDKQSFFPLGEKRAAVIMDPVLKKYRAGGPDKHAVDVGCGVGRFTQVLAKRFGEATGVDISEEMVSQAKAELGPEIGNIDYVVGDGLSFPVASRSADFVWSYEVFQHMPTHDVIRSNLAEVERVLKPSGYGLLHFRSAHEYPGILWSIARFVPAGIISAVKKIMGKDPLTADLAWRGAKPLSRQEIKGMCEEKGMRIIEFLNDPTHAAGSRTFAVVQSAG